jgi:hypothetical protein
LGATINSATLRIYQGGWYDYVGSVRTVFADCVTSAWHEAVATWNYAPTIGATVGSVNVGMSTGWYEINITALVREWYAGVTPNYGLLLRGYEGSGNLYRLFVPRLYVNEPQLVVDYTLQPATLGVTTSSISFKTDGNRTTPSWIVSVKNTGIDEINWSIDVGSATWLQISPTSGTTSASYATPVEISIIPSALSPGTHTAQVTVNAPGAQSSPQVIDVTVDYSDAPLPFVYLPLIISSVPGPVTSGKTVALLAGISDYEHCDPPSDASERTGDWDGFDLTHTHKVPRHYRKVLRAFAEAKSENVREYVDNEASYLGIQDGVVGWMDRREEMKPCALTGISVQSCHCGNAMFGITAHGGQDTEGEYFVATYDTDESGGYFINVINGPTLDSWLDDLDAQSILVIIDACKSGGLLPDLSQPGRVVITSARSDQFAWETGEFNGTVFAHYMVQGLMDPAADFDGDGWVSAEEAFVYAESRTDSYIYTQTGYHQNPQISDGVAGELRIARLPSYGPMVAGLFLAGDEVDHQGVVSFSSDPIPLPVTVSPLQ